jgi:hypothetical protein
MNIDAGQIFGGQDAKAMKPFPGSFSLRVLTLVSDDVSDIDIEEDAVKPGDTFTICTHADGKTTVTPYHGVLSEFEQLHQAGGYIFYQRGAGAAPVSA